MTREPGIDLETLRDEWQTDTGPSLNDMRREVRTAVLRARLSFALEVIITLLGIGASVVLLLDGTLALGIAVLAFSAFGGGAAVYANWSTWRVPLDTVTTELRNMIAAARQRRRAAWAGLAVCAAALVFLAAVVALPSPQLSATSTRLVIAWELVFIAAGMLVSARLLAKAIAREDRLRDFSAQYAEDDTAP